MRKRAIAVPRSFLALSAVMFSYSAPSAVAATASVNPRLLGMADVEAALGSSGPIVFENAEFNEPIELQGKTLTKPLTFKRCKFHDALKLAHSKFPELNIVASSVQDIDLAETVIEGHFRIDGSTFRDFQFADGQVEGNLAGIDVSVRSLNLSGIRVKGCVYLNGLLTSGDIDFRRSEIAGDLEIRKSDSRSPVISGEADFRVTTIRQIAMFDSAVFADDVDFGDMNAFEIHLTDTIIVGGLSSNGATVLKDVDLTRARVVGELDATNMAVGGSIVALELKSFGPAEFDRSKIADQLILDKASPYQELSLRRASVAMLRMNDFSIRDDVRVLLDAVRFEQLLMRSTTTKLATNQKIRVHEIDVETWNNFEQLLLQARLCPDVYQRFEEMLRRDGETELADDVFVSLQRRLAREELEGPKTWPRYVWSRARDWLVLYGRSPFRAASSAFVIILFGAFFFRLPRSKDKRDSRFVGVLRAMFISSPIERCDEHEMVPRDTKEPRKIRYNAFWFSLDAFAPIIDLDFAKSFRPGDDLIWTQRYLIFHRIAGWVLVPFAIGAAAGLIN